jgi:hypothetical protein
MPVLNSVADAHEAVFYERGMSRENFSRATSPVTVFDSSNLPIGRVDTLLSGSDAQGQAKFVASLFSIAA